MGQNRIIATMMDKQREMMRWRERQMIVMRADDGKRRAAGLAGEEGGRGWARLGTRKTLSYGSD